MRGCSRTHAAFTLIELIIASAIMTLIMAGLASAVLIAGHALPDGESATDAAAEAAEALDQLSEDLSGARWFFERSSTAASFTVPDRNGDGLPERVRYGWSGVAGEPLTRQYNGGAAVAVLDDVREFGLRYDVSSTTEQYSGAPVESAEGLLSKYTSMLDPGDYKIDTNKWIGQYFVPSGLPEAAVSWAVTRVIFAAAEENDKNDVTLVQLRPADASHLPTPVVLEEHEMYEDPLSSSYVWQTFNFSNVEDLEPGAGLCLVLRWGSGGPSAWILYERSYASGLVSSSNGGASWGYSSNSGLYHYVYGTYSTPGPLQTATRHFVTGVNVALRTGDEETSRIATAVQTPNMPELLSGLWEAYFDSDPTLDHNGDGNDDWIAGSGDFDSDALSDGVWHTDTRISTAPDSGFTGLTTIELAGRDTSADGQGAVLLINADRAGGLSAVLRAQIILQADNTQTMTLINQQADYSLKTLITVAGLPSDFVTLRLLIEPALDTINVGINGVDQGTRTYTRITPAADFPYAALYADGGSTEFDYVSIRVSE